MNIDPKNISVCAVTICVNYSQTLAITLPRNKVHFHRYLVVTSNDDIATQKLCESQRVEVYITDAFWREGAFFNKGLAIEEAFLVLDYQGWICHLDADILLPDNISDLWRFAEIGKFYGIRRRLLQKFSSPIPSNWSIYPIIDDGWIPGYFQLFNATDPILIERPWYGVDWTHAAGSDEVFSGKWPISRQKRFKGYVLHLGESRRDWCGNSTEGRKIFEEIICDVGKHRLSGDQVQRAYKCGLQLASKWRETHVPLSKLKIKSHILLLNEILQSYNNLNYLVKQFSLK